jgi:FkbM family methyltransferase
MTGRSPALPSRVITTGASSHRLTRARRSLAFWLPLARLTPGLGTKIRFWAVAVELTLRHKLGRPPRGVRAVTLSSEGAPVTLCIQDISELHGIREVFVQGDYAIAAPHPPSVILDLGANIGAASVYFATRWPSARIVAVEPDPDEYERLVRNTSPFGWVTALHLAAAAEDGQATLYRGDDTLTGSLLPQPDAPTGIPVQAVSLDSLMDGACGGHIDLLKFDIEGSEYTVLRSCERSAEIAMLVGELHEEMMGCSLDVFAGLFPGHRVEIEALPNGEHTFRAWLKQIRNRPKR